MVRSAGAFLTKVPGLTDWTKEASVKAHVLKVMQLHHASMSTREAMALAKVKAMM